MAITEDQVKPGLLVLHKGGKLYKIDSFNWKGNVVRWGYARVGETIEERSAMTDKTVVACTQWQINDKYPEGRKYQSSKMLKLKDLTIA